MPKKSILITGGAGFIGSHLAEKLLKADKEVFVIDDLSTGSLKNIAHLKNDKNFHFIKGTILDARTIEKLVKKVNQIYHLAAAVGVKTIIDKPLESFLLNTRGTEIVLDAAVKYKVPILITSTSEIYGKNDNLPFAEDGDRVYGSAYHARWGYAMSKGADEFLALAYHREKGLNAVIVRLFNVVGPRQTGVYGMVVPRFVQQALAGDPLTVYGDGYQTRCFGYVDDITDALVKLASHSKASGHIFNLGSDEEISIKELARKVNKLTGAKSKIAFVPYAKVYGQGFDDMARRRPDLSKIKKIIGYAPKITLEESLKRIIDYYSKLSNAK
ncbi:MAG: SDR family NAD(P)-dependent oxidoreductase [Candidatus Nealsonbacteria bacterium]|nr:SDR family NAD(P)-dependent oxidoreductase [Candidatus Nealsonbacteria bacterium]